MSSLTRMLVTGALLICALLAFSPGGASAQRARQGLLTLDDARLFYEVLGEGDPIIVVHGGPGLDHAYLRPGLDVLAARNTLIYYDQRGTGRSSAALDSSTINMDAFVDDIDALRQVLGYEQISVLAHSFGAVIALEYASRHPDYLKSLILMNPVEPGSRFQEQVTERQLAARTPEDSTELAALRATEGFRARDPATLSQVYRVVFRQTLRNRARIADLELDLAASTAKNGSDVASLLVGGMGPIDWWDRLPEIDVPTLVLHGRWDIPPVEMSLALAEAFPVGTFQVLDSGHFPYVEDRNGLLSAVSGFLAGLGR